MCAPAEPVVMPTPQTAKRLSSGLARLPFGSPTLDNRFRGIPAGSAVLLAGAPDAGTDAFAFTNAAATMQARYHPGLYKGSVAASRTALPEEVHLVTVARGRQRLFHQLDATLGSEQFNTLVEHLSVADFSARYRSLADVPDSLHAAPDGPETAARSGVPTTARSDDSFGALLSDLATHLATVGEDSLVVLDSLTAIRRATSFGAEAADVERFLLGLRDGSTDWDGLVTVICHARPEEVRSSETLNTVLNGCLYFYCNDEGTNARKTMRVGSFGGALRHREQVVYDTAVSDNGFRVRSSRNY